MIRPYIIIAALLLPPATAALAHDSNGGAPTGVVNTPAALPAVQEDAMPIDVQSGPPVPAPDRAADRYYGTSAMNDARKALLQDGGGMQASGFMVDRFEYRTVRGRDGYHWEGGGFFGGDLDRFAFKTEGEGEWRGKPERAEVQALYSHAIGPYFNLQAGARHDFQSGPKRSYGVIGVDGLAPYWFDVGAELFLSNHGEVQARIEASYDQRITQRLILQPQAELNFSTQNIPELNVGAGLSDFELGLRLRYEIVREFAPYVGFAWNYKMGRSADYARLASEHPSSAGLVCGIRFWF